MRLFIGISFPVVVTKKIEDYQESLKKINCTGRFSKVENLHLTLAFLGEIDNLNEVESTLKSCLSDEHALCFSLGDFSKFSKKNHETLILRTFEDECLTRLSNKIKSSLRNINIRFDDTTFKGHITICRNFKSPVIDLPSFAVINNIRIDEVVLFLSTLEKGKEPVYTKIDTYRLKD